MQDEKAIHDIATMISSFEVKYPTPPSGIHEPLPSPSQEPFEQIKDLAKQILAYIAGERNGVKKCPFCGGCPQLVEESCEGHNEGARWIVKCECGARVISDFYQGKEQAVTAWNKRKYA